MQNKPQTVELTQEQIQRTCQQIVKQAKGKNVNGLLILVHPSYYIHFLRYIRYENIFSSEIVVECKNVPLDGFMLVKKI